MHFSSAVGCVGTQVGENFAILQRIERAIPQDLQPWSAIQKRIERAIPQDLQPWSDYQPVRFVDALEGQVLLPFEICRDFQVIA